MPSEAGFDGFRRFPYRPVGNRLTDCQKQTGRMKPPPAFPIQKAVRHSEYPESRYGTIFQTAFAPPRYSGLTKIRTRRRAADSTNSTKPIHLVLQHLRESFSLS
ncbi:hypothetical protein [Neisseria lactamica]|uniref:hypothetical protein n=1 Tax=Neisseria lactamica TaxID=486 RepID=UPI00159D1F10|nr:hypothetical protein [Neisseria lactamica]